MNLIKRLASDVNRYHWWTRHTKVVIGVSTGVDSMVLLYLLEHLKYCRPRIIVAHVNHELRSASKVEEQYIRHYCKRNGLKLIVAHWSKRDHPRTGTENAARNFRYRFFKRVMSKEHASVLLTAHHLNDQAETILMRLIRGGDINELTGIHRCRQFAGGWLIRPLLSIPKRDLRSFAKVHRIKWYEDQTNYSLKITRNRMRHRLLPWMSREDPRVLWHIGSYTQQLTMLIRDNLALNARLINRLMTSRKNWWRTDRLCRYSYVIQWGLLHELFRRFNPRLMITPPMFNEIMKLLNDRNRPQGEVNITHRIHLEKSYRRFGIVRVKSSNGLNEHEFQVKVNRWYLLDGRKKFGIFDSVNSLANASEFKFYLADDDFPLVVKMSRPSDRLRLKNGGHQKIRRIWIDKKLSNHLRHSSRVLKTKNNVVLALLGYKAAFTEDRGKVKPYWLIIKGL